MNGEQANQSNNQPNESYGIWQDMANEVRNKNEGAPETSDTETETSDENPDESYELIPEQIEWREGHTDEEVDALADNWDNWASNGIGYYHGQILTDIFNDKELGWKFTDFKDFFDNSYEASFYTKRDENGRSVIDKLGDSLDTLKQVLGEESSEYSSAVKKIFIDIHDGKYKGSRLGYRYPLENEIIFANQEELIERDEEERKEAEEEEKRRREEQDKRRQEAWEKSWRNPNNDAAYKENMETIDRRTFDYLNKILFNLDEIAPAAKDLVMDAINQNILEGTFNGAYLNNQGYFYTGERAEEYRGYDQNRNENDSDGNEPPVSPIVRPNTGRKKPETKTPEDFGFRDWKN